jgi:hypothetical protein
MIDALLVWLHVLVPEGVCEGLRAPVPLPLDVNVADVRWVPVLLGNWLGEMERESEGVCVLLGVHSLLLLPLDVSVDVGVCVMS